MRGDQCKEERFEKIYRQYKDEVYRISLYYTKNEQESQDITQKVFYKFYLYFDKINPDCIKAYLFRSARNLSYNWLRDTKKELKNETVDAVAEQQVSIHNVEESYLHAEQERDVNRFFSSIMRQLYEENETWYEILNLIYCLELSHDEAAEQLGISKTVLYSKLYRAKQWLRKNFSDEYNRL